MPPIVKPLPPPVSPTQPTETPIKEPEKPTEEVPNPDTPPNTTYPVYPPTDPSGGTKPPLVNLNESVSTTQLSTIGLILIVVTLTLVVTCVVSVFVMLRNHSRTKKANKYKTKSDLEKQSASPNTKPGFDPQASPEISTARDTPDEMEACPTGRPIIVPKPKNYLTH